MPHLFSKIMEEKSDGRMTGKLKGGPFLFIFFAFKMC